MRVNVDPDQIGAAINQLRTIAGGLATSRGLSGLQTLASFSTASGLDEAGERLSPIGDERAPEANQAIALYLKHTADNLWLALTNTQQTDESFSGMMGSMLSPLRNTAATLTPLYSAGFQQLKTADPKTNTFDNAAVSGASESSLLSADRKLSSTDTALAYSASEFWTANARLIEDAMEELNGVHHSLSSSADTIWIAEAMKKVTQIQNAGLEYVANSRSLANHTEALGMAADAERMIASAAASAYLAAEDPEVKALIESDYLSSYGSRMTGSLSSAIPSFNRLLPDAGALPTLPYASTDVPTPAATSFEPTPLPAGLRDALTQRGLGDLAPAKTPAEVIHQFGRPTPETFERIAAGAAPTQAASAVLAPPAPTAAGSFAVNGPGAAASPFTPAPIGGFSQPAGAASTTGAATATGAPGLSHPGSISSGRAATGVGAAANRTPGSVSASGTGGGPRSGTGFGNRSQTGVSAGAVNTGAAPGAGRGGGTVAGGLGTPRGGALVGSAAGAGMAGGGMNPARPGFSGAGFGSAANTGSGPGLGAGSGATGGSGNIGAHGAGTGAGVGAGAHGAGSSGTSGTYAAAGTAGGNAQNGQGVRGGAVAAGPMGAAGANRSRGRDKSSAKVRTVTSAVERDGNLKALLGDAPLLLPSVIGHNVRG